MAMENHEGCNNIVNSVATNLDDAWDTLKIRRPLSTDLLAACSEQDKRTRHTALYLRSHNKQAVVKFQFRCRASALLDSSYHYDKNFSSKNVQTM